MPSCPTSDLRHPADPVAEGVGVDEYARGGSDHVPEGVQPGPQRLHQVGVVLGVVRR